MSQQKYALFSFFFLSQLLETDVLGVLSEASSAKLESVLTDDTVVASADAARVRSQAIVSTVRVPDVLVSHACACSCSKFESKFTRF